MPLRMLGLAIFVFALGLFVAAPAHGMGEKLGQTKEQLQLAYDVSCIEHGTGRVTGPYNTSPTRPMVRGRSSCGTKRFATRQTLPV